jgi:hypothetical protein
VDECEQEALPAPAPTAPLPDETVVIRGGENRLDVMREQANDEFRDSGTFSLSGAAEAGMTLDEVALTAQRPNPKICKTTAGRLRAIRCDVAPPRLDDPTKHVNIILFQQPPSDKDWERIQEAFDLAERNPHRR